MSRTGRTSMLKDNEITDQLLIDIHKTIDTGMTAKELYDKLKPNMSIQTFNIFFKTYYMKVYKVTNIGSKTLTKLDPKYRLYSRNELLEFYKVNQITYALSTNKLESWHISLLDLDNKQISRWITTETK